MKEIKEQLTEIVHRNWKNDDEVTLYYEILEKVDDYLETQALALEGMKEDEAEADNLAGNPNKWVSTIRVKNAALQQAADYLRAQNINT